MEDKYKWLLTKTRRSVDQLRLWSENPRLNPEETHLTLADYAEDLTYEKADRESFFDLVNSIVADGFVPYDPIIVWQNEDNKKFYVAEGNRRLTALKLLRAPHKAPKRIRSFIRNASGKINLSTIEKIPVNVAPTFEDAEWYINQRNSASSLQRRWTRLQQQRWIMRLYEKYNADIDKLESITKLSKTELEGFIRILKIKDFIKIEDVKNQFTEEEFDVANSYRFPITILERFFSFTEVKEKWGLEYNGVDVIIKSNKQSFYKAFGALVKRIISDEDNKLTTRFSKDEVDELLSSLPEVTFEGEKPEEESNVDQNDKSVEDKPEKNNNIKPLSKTNEYLKGNVDRNKIILDIYSIDTSSGRLNGLFIELQRISLTRYPSVVSASLRIFLDLAVHNYIETEGLEKDIIRECKCSFLRDITLKRRLEYIKSHHLKGKEKNIASRLLDETTQYSLDVLNGYIHSSDTHYLNKQFLNGFWDFLLPLFQKLVDIKENI